MSSNMFHNKLKIKSHSAFKYLGYFQDQGSCVFFFFSCKHHPSSIHNLQYTTTKNNIEFTLQKCPSPAYLVFCIKLRTFSVFIESDEVQQNSYESSILFTCNFDVKTTVVLQHIKYKHFLKYLLISCFKVMMMIFFLYL